MHREEDHRTCVRVSAERFFFGLWFKMLRMILNHRRKENVEMVGDAYSPKPHKGWGLTKPVDYLLKDQRLLFILIGMGIATAFFFFLQSDVGGGGLRVGNNGGIRVVREDLEGFDAQHMLLERSANRGQQTSFTGMSGAKMPLGLQRKPLRIVVTGGAGFVGSHLVDKLMARGDHVIVVDNFFTGRKENVMHHFGNHRFELIRHDVVEPLLLEVDQIYHLACPASPVFYKHNPVKTIISSLFFLFPPPSFRLEKKNHYVFSIRPLWSNSLFLGSRIGSFVASACGWMICQSVETRVLT